MLSLTPFPVLLFYKYVEIDDPRALAKTQRELCTGLGLKGRILIATEGVNGTIAGPEHAIDEYTEMLLSDSRFADIIFKRSRGDAQTFPKLVVKVRKEIVTLKAGAVRPAREDQLSPTAWKQMIETEPDVVLLDIRNRYESAAGRFEGAVACDIGHFRELPAYLPALEMYKNKRVMIHCTGGIRCEKAAGLLRERGFQQVYQLEGGIVSYQEQFGNEHWLGECFVFDQRMTVRRDEHLVQIGRCEHSGETTSRFVNCLHDPCHRLFLLSERAELDNPDYRLCPDCLASGLTAANADYRRQPTRIPLSQL